MNTKEFIKVIDFIAKEKNIDIETIEESIKKSISLAYKKKYPCNNDIQVLINNKKNKLQLFKGYKIVEVVIDPKTEISLKEVPNRFRKEAQETGYYYKEETIKDFGRLAIQTTKQLLIQNIENARRLSMYEEFKNRIGTIVSGKITSIDNKTGNLIVNLGKGESILYYNDQIKGEHFKIGQLIDVYLSNVSKTPKGVNLYISRKHPNYVLKLLEKEIPEIAKGIIEIKSIAREAGSKTKIAVHSIDKDFDSVGACIGINKNRITNVTDLLGNEKVEIIKWSEDPVEFIKNALSPATALTVILDENDEDKESLVIVNDDEYSLAIGKKGQNAMLTVMLTGWKVNIKSYTEAQELGIDI